MIGGSAVLAIALSLLFLARSLRSTDVEEDGPGLPGDPTPEQVAARPKESPKVREAQAGQLVEDARVFAGTGKVDQALERLRRILSDYAEIPSAKIAREAIDRHSQGLPLFVDGAAVIATRPDLPRTDSEAVGPPAEGAVVVEAVQPATPMNTAPTSPETNAAAPRTLAEPRRSTGVGLAKANVEARAVPPGFRAREEAGVHESGWPLEITCDRDGGTMVFIPGGIFTRGRDDGRPEERPAHKASLSPYYIDQHEVTANQLALFKGGDAKQGDRPAVGVSLPDARAYAEWAGKSIPTEAQWEMAARTSDGRIHPWGNSPAKWDRPRLPKQVDPVMSFASDLSPYGVFDLAGNAWEWTNDWFDAKAYAAFKGQTPTNPTGPAQGKGRLPEVVIKGGSKDWDASWRSGMRPEARLPHLGFRCVLNFEGAPQQAPPTGVPGTRAPSGGVVF